MRTRLLLLTAGLTALALPAPAQDLMGWSEPTVDWSGFYAGVFAGYGLGTAAATSGTFSAVQDNLRYDSENESTRLETAFGGGEVGYDLQYGRAVFGAAADLTLGGFSRQSANGGSITQLDPPNDVLSAEGLSTWRTNAIGTVTGRLGVAAGNWLIYGTGGLTVADVTTFGYIRAGIDGDPATEVSSAGRRRGLLLGSTVGIGAEGMVADNISIGVEYTYTSFPGQGSDAGSVAVGTFTFRPPTIDPVSMHSLKIGAKYHF